MQLKQQRRWKIAEGLSQYSGGTMMAQWQ